MKPRLLVTLMALAVATTLTACGKESTTAADAAKKAAGEAADKAKEAASKAGEAAKEATKEAAHGHHGRGEQGRRRDQGCSGEGRRCGEGSGRAEEVTRLLQRGARRRPWAGAVFCARDIDPARNGSPTRTRASAIGRRVPRDPARQRLPLLPVLLAARARQIEDRRAVARAVDIDLRVAQVRDHRKLERLEERIELGGAHACADRRASRRCRARARPSGSPSVPGSRRESARRPPCRRPTASAARASRRRAARRRAGRRRASPAGVSTTRQSGSSSLCPCFASRASPAMCGNSAGRRCEPFRRRALRIEVAQDDLLPLAREPAGDVGRERRLAAAAFGIGDEDRLHRSLPGS